MIGYDIEFHPDVEKDYSEAHHWYEIQLTGLGDKFLGIVTGKLEFIALNPLVYSEKGKKGYREAIVDTFPYVIVYKVYEKKKIVFVVSVHNQKKKPTKKYRK